MSLTAQAKVRSSSPTAPVHRGRRAPRHVLVGVGLINNVVKMQNVMIDNSFD